MSPLYDIVPKKGKSLNMKFEEAMKFLRNNNRIYRTSSPEKGSLCGTIENVMGSFYLTIYDVLADDWDWCHKTKDPSTFKKEE